MQRIEELDSLRGISVILVLLFHYTHSFSDKFPSYTLTTNFIDIKYGGIGVNLFFIISGFVIFLTANNIKNSNRFKSTLIFLYKRFIRLYPLFWLCMITTFFIMNNSDIVELDKYKRDGIDFIFNLTMIPDVFNQILSDYDIERIDGVYWSLIPELFFYSIMSIIIFFKGKKYIEYICLFWLFIIFSGIFADKFSIDIPPSVSNLFILDWGYLFIIGINFFKIKSNKDDSNFLNHSIILISLLGGFFLEPTQRFIFSILFVIIFYLFVYDKLKWLTFKPLIFFGKISYALYLLHQFIGYAIIMKLIKSGVENSFILLVVPSVIAIALSYICTEIDIKINKYLKSFV